jgi:transcriptional regulator with XRE-family HTH domain
MDIGRRIREEREELGMPRAVLARRVGAVPQHLYLIENGERTPSVGMLEKIARVLRIEPALLLQERETVKEERPLSLGPLPKDVAGFARSVGLQPEPYFTEGFELPTEEVRSAYEAVYVRLLRAEAEEAYDPGLADLLGALFEAVDKLSEEADNKPLIERAIAMCERVIAVLKVERERLVREAEEANRALRKLEKLATA